MHRRFHSIFSMLILISQTNAAFASDWIEDEFATAGSIFPAPSSQATQSLAPTISPFSTQAQLQEAAKSGAPRLHFAQALDALEIDIFAKKNVSDDITKRLDLLEKAVFASTPLPELSDNMARLMRIVSAVHISDHAMEAVTQAPSIVPQQSTPLSRNHHRGLLSKTLHSPTFWLLVGATGVVLGAYFLSRSSSNAPDSRYINPNQHYVGPYLRNGQWVGGGMRTMPNGITTDNLSHP